jgi:hypothetical protein
MSETDERKQMAFNYGQIHGLKALAHALVRTHPDAALLMKEFQKSCDRGLDQIRASPVPHGSNRSYRQFCDEFIVALGRKVGIESRPRRKVIL